MLDKIIEESHLEATHTHWAGLGQAVQGGWWRHGCPVHLTDRPETINAIKESVVALAECIREGYHIYGVNTGFGGSADSRTGQMVTLQGALLQLLQSGILTTADTSPDRAGSSNLLGLERHSMPPEWVKATMLVRSNTVARGHSAVSVSAINSILRLLREGITPVVPLRGTISASGDLMPLAYVVGAAEGSPDVFVQVGGREHPQIITAQTALKSIGADALTLGPKEALGLVNGTAASSALAGLVLYEAHQLALLAQAVTGLTVEALQGHADSFHPLIAEVRPQRGQIEAARNILAFLRGSRLTQTGRKTHEGLAQDRYSLRTASQWIGPQLEDLLLADRQVSIELNSTSDNPLIDTAGKTFYSGGNFQATSVTSAMEKTRLALQMLGKLLFVQTSEIIDPGLNNGLPTNLVADDPSLSFTMKGVDINMAAYMSELAYLANPVSSHVQTAEMHNQAVNSLAFLSARYTMQAVDVVTMMGACALYVACQALDLRVVQLQFFQDLRPFIHRTTKDAFGSILEPREVDRLSSHLLDEVCKSWASTSRMDLCQRCRRVTEMTLPCLFTELSTQIPSVRQSHGLIDGITDWQTETAMQMEVVYRETLARSFISPATVDYCGAGSKAMYIAIRRDVGVPFHQGFAEHPLFSLDEKPELLNGRAKRTIGGWISMIYEALRGGSLTEALLKSFD
ncbi:phenylalanine ammonia-lyase [Aspergillus indologenus CBS 114.80]|uniref:Phenylalanine ammonia-lyase n=1 Tax=Aspergillus indologenus CBS 114.80 TaxID=1450541 RepID=A0A2V5J849_9EURO|nr:phenylalanine ammonia-lyase [Aspergillus indologenus CBS 114.80]